MIYVLKGNTIRNIGLPLQNLTIVSTGETLSDYYPSETDSITVRMVSNPAVIPMDVTVSGNVLNWTWTPEIVGCFGIEVVIVREDGIRMRSYRKNQIKVVSSNDQLRPNEGDVEFVYQYLTLKNQM